ncbi:hypothetical protein BN7_5114 [Wickerhamomyces ciferrii]|uniref:Uncharacterized protein n=1 Tax=Wickerhamomyces ciferrii (strain ATCC 14091 / BCRC 22168 / CBS 111 / JCM 3599 / NBRC 0793 / NRRL Y-1031 F-60-10) TaxID=1206466 RepID=K0KU28_WICCF|nr:uncharacterized protein BN7_5114 [Wickerhamomyces ciferrii]CCH45532.1 hypothetical protein BN7_5114 [Wickerhamomyces ciferrii]
MRSILSKVVIKPDIFIGCTEDAARRWIIEIEKPKDIEVLLKLFQGRLSKDSSEFPKVNRLLSKFLLNMILLGVADILVTDGFQYLYIELKSADATKIEFNYYYLENISTKPTTIKEFLFWWFYKKRELEVNQLIPLSDLINKHLKTDGTSQEPDVEANGRYKFGIKDVIQLY